MNDGLVLSPDTSEENLMNLIGESILENITDSWNTVTLTFKVLNEGVYEAEIQYTNDKNETLPALIKYSQTTIRDAFLELRSRMQVKNYAMWNKAIFTISTEGEVFVDFKYQK